MSSNILEMQSSIKSNLLFIVRLLWALNVDVLILNKCLSNEGWMNTHHTPRVEAGFSDFRASFLKTYI